MSLQVIGAGLGRTGTMSLMTALERLGFGPCYHMMQVLARVDDAPSWQQFAAGERSDWDSLLGEFGAAVDWPASYFWRELAAHYPQAKVVLTVRDANRWHASISSTLFRFMRATITPDDVAARQQIAMARDIVQERTFDNELDDREHLIGVYQRHNRAVQAALGSDRLLVYDVAQGWAPLCDFLAVPVPSEPFPRVNAREQLLSTHAERYHTPAPGSA